MKRLIMSFPHQPEEMGDAVQIGSYLKQCKHRINNSCTWGSKHALVIRGLKLFNFFQFEN
jgi:hypothetical protein